MKNRLALFTLIAKLMSDGMSRHTAESEARFRMASFESPIYFPPKHKRGWAKRTLPVWIGIEVQKML